MMDLYLFEFQANQTFEEFARLYRLIDDWLEVSPVVYDYLSTSQDVENIRVRFSFSPYMSSVTVTHHSAIYA